MSGFKRKGHEQAIPLDTKRTHLGDVNPGKEYVEPKIYQQPTLEYGEQLQGTNFHTWSEPQIKAFLDQRGGDYDDCQSFQQLVERAAETEVNTGPAGAPPATAAAGGELPAPPTAAGTAATAATASAPAEDDEYDPLEAFMAEINQEVAAHEAQPAAKAPAPGSSLACDEVADPGLDYMAARSSRGGATGEAAALAAQMAAKGYDSDEEVYATARALEEKQGQARQYDQNDNLLVDHKKVMDLLAPVDHSSISYDDFAKDFYTENPAIAAMSLQQVNEVRRQLEVRVAGYDVPKPIQTFGQAGFDHLLLGAIKKAGYDKPTAIQAQAMPAVLSGRDVLGIAKTGSGKTAAFVLPMLVHIMDQPELQKGEGPIGLVLAPTRELAEQIHKEARKFSKPYGLRVAAAFGGLSKYEQVKELKAGSEVAVATPGRMMDLIKMKACTVARVTYVVLDEADRMFDMGFEAQVRCLLSQVRPDRQILLFSATLPRRIERLVTDTLSAPVRITVGQTGAANEDIKQHVEVFADEPAKAAWLSSKLPGFIDTGDVVLFVGQRARVEELVARLTSQGVRAGGIHGDMDQYSRMQVLDAFRAGTHHILVATDVAARGLDIKSIKTVINYEAAKDVDTHIHRVGRTGRAGDKEGVAWTLLDRKKDAHFAAQLVNSLALSGQEVPGPLHELAMKDQRFRKGSSRSKGGKGGGKRRGPQVGGAGLGFGQPKASSNNGLGAAARQGGPPPPGQAGSGFVKLPGFAKAHDDYEHESSAAAAAAASGAAAAAGGTPGVGPSTGRGEGLPGFSQAQGDAPTPAPAAPAPASGASGGGGVGAGVEGGGGGLPGFARAAGGPAGSSPSGSSGVVIQPPSTTSTTVAAVAAAAGGAGGGTGPGATGSGGGFENPREYVRNLQANQFKSSFVSSGTTGGDIGQTATIILPKSSASKATVPPPVPVSQRPMYLTRPGEDPNPRRRGQVQQQQGLGQQPMGSALQSAAAQQAAAAAAAIAARLAAQAPGAVQLPPGGPGSTGYPGAGGSSYVAGAPAAAAAAPAPWQSGGPASWAGSAGAGAGSGAMHPSVVAAMATAERLAAAGGAGGEPQLAGGAVPPPWAHGSGGQQQQQQQPSSSSRGRWDSR